jgi:hypothetical protein
MLLPITAVMGWLDGNAVVLGAFVLREFARRATPEKHYANGDAEKTVGCPQARRVEDSYRVLHQSNL